MMNHGQIKSNKREEATSKRDPSIKQYQSLYGQLEIPNEDVAPIADTPFWPQVDKHVALLAEAHSGEQRANLVLQLQKTYGNAYVQRLLNSKFIQAKLTVNPPDDVYEKEADRVASIVTQVISGSEIQRQADEEEEEVQAKAVGSQSLLVSEDLERQIDIARGSGGQPLSEEIRQPMEQAFGADLSEVRVHNDAGADTLSQVLQARAFTTGKDIFFREGAYQPGSEAGKELLAHELTHVVQQSHRPSAAPTRVTQPSEAAEVEARTMGEAVSRRQGMSVTVQPQMAAVIARQETGQATKAPKEAAKPGPEPTKKVVLEGKPLEKLYLITFQGKVYNVAEKDYLTYKSEAIKGTRMLVNAAFSLVKERIAEHTEYVKPKPKPSDIIPRLIREISDMVGLTKPPPISIWNNSANLLKEAGKKLDGEDLKGAVLSLKKAEKAYDTALKVWQKYRAKSISGAEKAAKAAKFISDLSFDIATAIATPAFVAGGVPPPLAAATIRAAFAGVQNEAIQLSAMALGLQEPEFNWEELSGEVTEKFFTTLAKELTKGLLKDVFVNKVLEGLKVAFGPAPSPTYEQVITFLMTAPAQAKVKQAIKNVVDRYKGSKKYPELGPLVDEVGDEVFRTGIKESFKDYIGLK
jgi:hypothetical protein